MHVVPCCAVLQGYAGLGFPLAPGRMVPADAVIGRLDNTTGAVKVRGRTAQHSQTLSLHSFTRSHSSFSQSNLKASDSVAQTLADLVLCPEHMKNPHTANPPKQVHSFRLTAQQAGGIKPAPGWAHGLGGLVRPKAGSKGSSSGVMTVCFSRQAAAKASMVPNLDPSSESYSFF
jgi:hypothetical protein